MDFVVLGMALLYAFLNGLHDAPAVLAQIVSTRSLEPHKALIWVAVLEFVGAAFFSGAVLKTMSFGDLRSSLDGVSASELQIFVLAALAAAFIFNALTWYAGIPSSSSHALFGAMAGAALAMGFGGGAFLFRLAKLVGILMASAGAAVAVGWAVTAILYSLDITFKAGSVLFPFFNTLTSGALAVLHGANDAPKSLGLFFLATGGFAAGGDSAYVYLFAAVISMGMLFGENRILRTLGLKLFKIRTLQGSGANAASCLVLGMCTGLGFPVSFTQVLVGSISGAGTARRLRAVRWEVAGDILISWMVTLPVSIAMGYAAAKLLSV